MVVSAGQEARPGRRAQGRRVEVAVAQPACGQLVEVGGVDEAAEAAQMPEAGVVQQDDHYVWRACRREYRVGPPRLGLAGQPADRALEVALSHGQRSHAAGGPVNAGSLSASRTGSPSAPRTC